MRRQALVKKLSGRVLLAIQPGLSSGAADTYVNDQNYLPFANFLSEEMGQLFVPAYESDFARLKIAIAARRYPVVYAGSALSPDLQSAGYVPIAINSPDVSAAFVVRAKSTIRRITQLRGRTIAVDSTGPVTPAAIRALRSEGLGNSVRIVSSRGPLMAQVLPLTIDGTVDVGVLSSPEVSKIEEAHPGTIRIVASYPAGVTDGIWADPKVLAPEQISRLSRAIVRMVDADPDSAKSLRWATNLPVRFGPASR